MTVFAESSINTGYTVWGSYLRTRALVVLPSRKGFDSLHRLCSNQAVRGSKTWFSLEVGNGSRRSRRGIWDAGYAALPRLYVQYWCNAAARRPSTSIVRVRVPCIAPLLWPNSGRESHRARILFISTTTYDYSFARLESVCGLAVCRDYTK